MKKAFTILRVSEEDQKKGYGPEAQGADVDKYIQLRSASLVEVKRILVDERATTWHRPEFEALVNEIINMRHQQEVDVAIFPRRNRLGRKASTGAYYLTLLEREGLEIHFAREQRQYNPDDPESFDWVMRGLSQAQADADEIRANTTAGRLIRAKEHGLMPTGGEKFAYRYHHYRHGMPTDDPYYGRYTLKAEGADWVRTWTDMILVEGASLNECCRRYKEGTKKSIVPSTVRRILDDHAIIGKFYAFRTRVYRDSQGVRHRITVPESERLLVYEDPELAIITEAEFYALQAQFKRNSENVSRNTKYQYPPLRGMVRCLCSGREIVMVGQTQKKGRGPAYYTCRKCRRFINAYRLWADIRQGLTELLLAPERLGPAVEAQLNDGTSIASLEYDLRLKRDELKDLDRAEGKAIRMYLDLPDYPVEKIKARRHEINITMKRVLSEISKLEQHIQNLKQAMADKESLNHFCEIAARNLDKMDDKQWRLLLERMGVRILIDGETRTVRATIPKAIVPEGDIVLSASLMSPAQSPPPSSNPRPA